MAQRQRVTVTLREDLLHSLDRLIDRQRVRNRSHALELILDRALTAETRQAVILASGRGVKMRPFTYEIPKPLIPVNGRPLLEHTILRLRRHGISDIVLTVSHLAHKIESHFGDGSRFGVRLTYVRERRPSGTGGALAAARPHLDDAPFLMMYGDVLLNLDIMDFLQTHQNSKAAVGSLVLTDVADPSAYGAVRLRGNRIVDFSEKPATTRDVSRLVSTGCAAFDPSVFSFLPSPRAQISLERDVFPRLVQEGRLYGYVCEGQWFDVSTPETYEQVLKEWRDA